MKIILRMLPVVIICSCILIIFPEKSYACDCITVSAEDAFQNDVVFEGKVIGVGRKEGVGIEVLFEVKEIWKGQLLRKLSYIQMVVIVCFTLWKEEST